MYLRQKFSLVRVNKIYLITIGLVRFGLIGLLFSHKKALRRKLLVCYWYLLTTSPQTVPTNEYEENGECYVIWLSGRRVLLWSVYAVGRSVDLWCFSDLSRATFLPTVDLVCSSVISALVRYGEYTTLTGHVDLRLNHPTLLQLR